MSTIDIQPRAKINYYSVLRQISLDKNLSYKLLDGANIRPIKDPSYLISMGTLSKLDALENDESYVVDTVSEYMELAGNPKDSQDIKDNLTQRFLRSRAGVNLNTEVESYDLVLDLLYNIKQAEEENLLSLSDGNQNTLMQEAVDLYLHFKYSESLDKFLMLAESENARAMYFLGELYCNKLPDADKNVQLGIEWRQRGADLGDALCKLNLAYHRNLSEEEQMVIIQSVIGDMHRLAESGDMFAADELASCFEDGNGVEENLNEAKKWYLIAAQLGFVKCMNKVANMYWNENDYTEANKWYRKAGDNGYDWGWYNLGGSYSSGKGVEKNELTAIEYYNRAYDLQGDAVGESANAMGNVYWRMERFEEANQWYEKAGRHGYDWGWYNLAGSYKSGKGVSKNIKKALELYEKTYNMGNQAMGNIANQIGIIYSNEDDDELAVEWYQKAANTGYDWGWYNLGYKYRNGQGIREDKAKAIECYQKAYDLQDEAAKDAAKEIADIYINELYDFDEGKKWQAKCN